MSKKANYMTKSLFWVLIGYITTNLYAVDVFLKLNEMLWGEVHIHPTLSIEPHREKTGFLPRRKQRRRSASRLPRS